ncbi:MAG: acyl-CoA dehydrogenase family protein [Anaerolineae bacterium]|nr:acyl-CoA dehydrogenase family protein [Anaerolineae bacterium]NUQ05130.1 acyl-CoA dehydrogenase family protein [Anaerolineae bacterium]
MDFSLPPHIEALTARVRQFIETEVIPLESQMHENPDGIPAEALAELRTKAKAAGVFAPQLPVELGGLGLSLSEIIPIFEAAGRSLLGPLALNCAAPDEGNMHLLHLFANVEQRQRFLEPLAAGVIRSGFAMTEPHPGAGSDPTMLQTRADPDGDDWVINGHKWYTTGADGAAFLLIMARTNPDLPAQKGATIFLADLDTPGIEMARRIPVMDANNPGGHGEIYFRDLRLPSSAILGEVGQGFALTQARLGPARLTHCMRWTGIAQRALEIATAYAVQREAFGKTLSEHEAVQWMLADSALELHAGRLMMQQAAWLLEKGDQARSETSMCKIYVAESVNWVLDRAIQITGGLGISHDIPLSTWYQAARAFRIYDGASEVHRMVVARGVVKKYGAGKVKG